MKNSKLKLMVKTIKENILKNLANKDNILIDIIKRSINTKNFSITQTNINKLGNYIINEEVPSFAMIMADLVFLSMGYRTSFGKEFEQNTSFSLNSSNRKSLKSFQEINNHQRLPFDFTYKSTKSTQIKKGLITIYKDK